VSIAFGFQRNKQVPGLNRTAIYRNAVNGPLALRFARNGEGCGR
jgi:hypothetical protein